MRRLAQACTILLIVGISALSCNRDSRLAEVRPPLLSLPEIGIKAEFGVREGEGRLGVLRRPMDAIFSGDEVLVLDASPPWVRVFDREGHFLRAMVREGQGPGEVGRPYTLTATKDSGFVMAHRRGVDRLDREGNLVLTARHAGKHLVYGAVEACGGHVFVLARSPGEINGPGLLLRVGPDGTLGDTLAVLDPLRPRNQVGRRRASFLEPTKEGILLYPEELNRDRLLEVGCNGRVLRDIEVDSLGEPETIVPGWRPGTVGLKAAQPPHPGGIAHVDGRVLWAALVVGSPVDGSVDSTTVITAFDAEGSSRSVAIHGWFQLFDSDVGGSLLLGNADGLYPSILLVDGITLLRLIDETARITPR